MCLHDNTYLCILLFMSSRIISIALAKGGVGKTTTSVNLAAGLVQKGRRVLIVDTDTQDQIPRTLGIQPPYGLYELATQTAAKKEHGEVLFEARPNLYVIAGGDNLTALKNEIMNADFRREFRLADTLEKLEPYFDYILIDNSPGWDSLSINIQFCAQELLCPISLETLAITGLRSYLNRLERIQEARKSYKLPPVELRYILPTMLDTRVAQSAELLSGLREKFSDKVCEPIRVNVRLSEAPAYGQTIFEYAPKSRGAEDYGRLTERVMKDE